LPGSAGAGTGAASPQVTGAGQDWPMWGYDVQRTGFNPNETALDPSTVSGLHLLWKFRFAMKSDSAPVLASGVMVGESPEGNRKDIRNAVEAAHSAAKAWGRATGHNRGQILYYIAENLSVRAEEFAERIEAMTECGAKRAKQEVQASVARLFTYGAWADKYDGAVHSVPIRGVAIAMNEPIGVIGIACPDEFPLLGMISLVGPAMATGNTSIVIPSSSFPLAATDFYSVLETSDVPAGVINIVTGDKDTLAKVLAEHDDVEAVWYFGARDGVRMTELASASNMKRTWATWRDRDWLDANDGEGREFLRAATQVKNIWVPYGE